MSARSDARFPGECSAAAWGDREFTDPIAAADGMRALARRARFVTATPEWHSACVLSFHGSEQARRDCVAVCAGHVSAWAPLVRSERADGTWLELAGAEALYEPGEILHQDVAALTALFERVLAFGEPVELRRIRKEAAVAAALRRCARGRGWVFRVDAARAIFLEPARCPDRNALFASGDRRRDLDRKRRRLAESGVPAFEWLKPDTSDVDRIVALALDIEGSGWKTHAGTSVAQKPALAKFVRHVTRAFAEQGRLIVAFLTLNGAPIAMQVILVHNSAWCELKIGYDPRWRPMSPGVLLAEATALKACEEGIERYEFMGNEEPRHGTFAHRAHEFETLVYVPLNRQGLRLLGKMVWERSRLKASASPV